MLAMLWQCSIIIHQTLLRAPALGGVEGAIAEAGEGPGGSLAVLSGDCVRGVVCAQPAGQHCLRDAASHAVGGGVVRVKGCDH